MEQKELVFINDTSTTAGASSRTTGTHLFAAVLWLPSPARPRRRLCKPSAAWAGLEKVQSGGEPVQSGRAPPSRPQ